MYFSMRNPTAEDRHGARPPAVRMATFAYGMHSLGSFRARGGVVYTCVWYACGAAAAAAWAGRDGADLAAHLPAFRRMCVSCMRRPSHALAAASSAGTGNGAARTVPATRSGRA